jgi:hypothetical protein
MPLSIRDVGPLLARFQCRDEEGRSCAPLLDAASSRPFNARDPWVDTTTPNGRLMLTVLGGRRRVRTGPDPAAGHAQRPKAKVRPQAEADQAPSARGAKASGRQRAAARSRAVLSLDDQSTQGAARCRSLIEPGGSFSGREHFGRSPGACSPPQGGFSHKFTHKKTARAAFRKAAEAC